MDNRIKQEKDRLRQELRLLTRSLPDDYIEYSDREIEQKVLALDEWKQARKVCVYVSVGREPQTRGLIRAALDAGKTVAIPRTLGLGIMTAHVITSLDGLQPGPFGIPEPDGTSPMLLPETIDLMIVPCIAADRRGYRLGHGGGYYDRYLVQTRCPSVCLCRGRLLQTEIPHNSKDISIENVISEC